MQSQNSNEAYMCEDCYCIEIDCPPGTIRPKHLIDGILKDTGITWDTKHPVPCFGNAVYNFPNVSEETWSRATPIIKDRILKLYNSGAIRYGSW